MARHGNAEPRIDSVFPPAAIPGGQLEVRGRAMALSDGVQPQVLLGKVSGRLVLGTRERLVVRIPDKASDGEISIRSGATQYGPHNFSLGQLLTDEVHPVANPAVDAQGNVFTTQSGARGKKTPVSVFKVDLKGNLNPFLSGIMNATGLLFRPDGSLLISSRQEGTVYSVATDSRVEVFAEGMGVATGLAIDSAENVYVGDRTGTVFKISRERKIYVFATLEASVAAYHLAVGPEGDLFVTAPTASSFDSIYRIDSGGAVSVWRRGFGRPQGIAFDAAGRLHICASHRGQRGIFRMDAQGEVRQVVSGQGIVGLAFTPRQDIVAATGTSIYHIPNPG